MLLSDQLIEARKRIENPNCWIKGTFGRDGSYCMLGAVGLGQSFPVSMNEQVEMLTILSKVVGISSLTSWNDQHTHEEVLAAFDRAIEIALANEQEFEESAVEVQAEDLGYQLVENIA